MNNEFLPKSFTSFRSYTRQQFIQDTVAGVIVGIVALPLAIAFAIASGVSPISGLYTAIVAGFIVSAFGGSRVQIGGPTGAFVVVVYGIVQTHGLDGLMIATIMAGMILIVLGIAKFGTAIKFIPHPVIVGFTSGIAVIIFTGQLNDFLGLGLTALPPHFFGKLTALANGITMINPSALGLALLSLAIMVVWPRISYRIPGPFVALIATTAAAAILKLPVETIGSHFGSLPSSLPHLSVPQPTFELVTTLIGPAFTLALLAAVESLLSAVVADGMIGGRHRSNMELIAQGMANIASPLFGGIPATGALARTATNIKNGGRTPVAGIVHAFTLLLITLFFGKWASLIPLATLSAVLMIVAYHMSEWRTFRSELSSPKSDVAVLLTTFALTVLVDLTVAIEIGMVLAAFLFMRRMAEVSNIDVITTDPANKFADQGSLSPGSLIPEGVEVFEISGPFFFGAAQQFKDTLGHVAHRPQIVILGMRDVPVIDSTGIHVLRELAHRYRKDGTLLLLADVRDQPRTALSKSTIAADVPADRIFATLDAALASARSFLKQAAII